MNEAKNSAETTAAPIYQNQVRLVGYIGKQPERYEGRTVFTVATQSSWKPVGSEEWKQETEWHRVVAWGKLAAIGAEFVKGDYVSVEGELRSSQYERIIQASSGTDATVTIKAWQIRARAMQKLERKKKALAVNA